MAHGSEGTQIVLIGSEWRRIGSAHPQPSKKRRPASAGSRVGHKASDDHVLSTQDIHRITARWDRGPWPVLEERKTVIVRPQQPAGEDGIVRIPHVVGAKLEKHRDDEEWVVVIETCHQCECHRQEWLRHDPQDYRSALELAQTACKGLEGARPLRCIHLETPDLGQRIGAFEVFLLPPRVCEPGHFAYLIHSKLLTRKWPSQQSLVHRLRDDMPRLEKSWKLVLHGLKSNLDIFSCWKKAQEEAKLLEEEMGEIASYAEKRVADLEDQLTELPEIQYQVEQLENQRSDLMEQLKTCQLELQSSTCRERDLQSELQEKKESNLRAQGELRANLQRTEDQLKDRDATIKDLAANQGQLLEAQQAAGSTNQALQKELGALRLQMTEDQGRIRSLEDENRHLSAERSAWRSEISSLKEELAQVEDRNRKLEDEKKTLTESLEVCEQQKWAAETEQQTLNRSILSTSLREKELQKDLWLMEEMKLTSEEELKAKLVQLEDQLKEKDATIKDLAASQAQMLDAQQMATANQTLQREVDLLRTERQEFHSQIGSLQDEKRFLSAEQEAQRTALDGLREELDAMSSSNAELKGHLEESLLQLQAQRQADRSGQVTLEVRKEPVGPKEPEPAPFGQVAVLEPVGPTEPVEPARTGEVAVLEPVGPTEPVEPARTGEALESPEAEAMSVEATLPPEVGAPCAPTGAPVLLEGPTIEAVTRSEVSDEEVSTDTDISVAGDSSDEISVMQ